MSIEMDKPTAAAHAGEREAARRRLESRQGFSAHLVAYIVVNAFFAGIWAVTGMGYFWPAWVLGGWGIGLVLHAWDAFIKRPITEAEIDAEVRKYHRDR